jgi:chorismate mutase
MPDATDSPGLTPQLLAELEHLRHSIDNIDAALVNMLAERFKLTRAVGEFKARHSLPPADPSREARQIERLRALSVEARLDPAIADKYLEFVVSEVLRHHEAIAKEHRASKGRP